MNEVKNEIRNVDIFKNSVALSLTIGKIGIRRKVQSEKVDVKDDDGNVENVDKDQVHVQKEILKCEEFDAINSIDSEVRIKLQKLALPAPFRRGLYLVPLALLERIDLLIQSYLENRDKAVESFMAVYEVRKDENKKKLGSLYCESDYPPAGSVKNSFYCRVSYMNLGVPDSLSMISPDVFKREKSKFEAQLDDAAEEIRFALRAGFSKLVASMVDRLRDDDDGGRKKFHDSLVKNMQEFLDVFEARNIAQDAELQNLIEKAKKLTEGVDGKVLREDDGLRKKIQEGFEVVEKELSNLVERAPRRKLELE